MPKSTVRRILETLCFRGMVNHADGGYVLGPLAARLGQKITAGLPEPILPLVMPHLLLLHEVTHGVVCLGVLCGTEVNCVQTLHREADVPLARRLSRAAPVHHVALGRALLGRPDETHIDIHNKLVVLAMAVNDGMSRPLASIAVAGPYGRFATKSATTHLRTATSNTARAIRPFVINQPVPND
jgi:DNA-binding IclR family transcriptional regulator